MKKPPKLPEAELDVMQALWSFSQPVRTARILEALQVDETHVMESGVIVKEGGASLVEEINEHGFGKLSEDR